VVSVYGALALVVVNKTLTGLSMIESRINDQLDNHEAFSAFNLKSSPLQKIKFWECEEWQFLPCPPPPQLKL
jgi:hypothetical protein